MRLTRKRYEKNSNAEDWSLVARDWSDPNAHNAYFLEAPFSLRILGHDEREHYRTHYWYTMTFTPREMKRLLSQYIRQEKMPDWKRNCGSAA